MDATGTAVATYAYDAWGVVTVNTENFANGWHTPYLYDGRDGVRYDTETGLYWMSVRAYDPTLGRFISQDPLGRAPLFWATQPYVYAGNNPLRNTDPSGQMLAASDMGGGGVAPAPTAKPTTIQTTPGKSGVQSTATCDNGQVTGARECYRWTYVHGPGGLDDQAGWWRIGGHAAIFLASGLKLLLDIKGGRAWNAVMDGLDFFSQFTDLLVDVGDKIGGWFQHVAVEASIWTQRLVGVLDFVRGILNMPFVGQVIQYQLNLVMVWLMPWLAGPFGYIENAIAASLGGAAMDLLAGGGHLALAQADQLEENARLDDLMSLDAFCIQVGGCPRG